MTPCLICSCGSEKKEDEVGKKEESSAPKHIHEWKPTEPNLINGQKIYILECDTCHGEGEEGAPRLSNVAQWEKREAKGLETLIDHAINGFQGQDGKMPARGGTKSLTDEEVTNAVKFMIATPKK